MFVELCGKVCDAHIVLVNLGLQRLSAAEDRAILYAGERIGDLFSASGKPRFFFRKEGLYCFGVRIHRILKFGFVEFEFSLVIQTNPQLRDRFDVACAADLSSEQLSVGDVNANDGTGTEKYSGGFGCFIVACVGLDLVAHLLY